MKKKKTIKKLKTGMNLQIDRQKNPSLFLAAEAYADISNMMDHYAHKMRINRQRVMTELKAAYPDTEKFVIHLNSKGEGMHFIEVREKIKSKKKN